jgi:hypothetical protein
VTGGYAMLKRARPAIGFVVGALDFIVLVYLLTRPDPVALAVGAVSILHGAITVALAIKVGMPAFDPMKDQRDNAEAIRARAKQEGSVLLHPAWHAATYLISACRAAYFLRMGGAMAAFGAAYGLAMVLSGLLGHWHRKDLRAEADAGTAP